MINDDLLKFKSLFFLDSHGSISTKSLFLSPSVIQLSDWQQNRWMNRGSRMWPISTCAGWRRPRGQLTIRSCPCSAYVHLLWDHSPSCSQVDWGMFGWGTSRSHWVGGSTEEWCHSCKIGSSICSKCCWTEEDLWFWTAPISCKIHTYTRIIVILLLTNLLSTDVIRRWVFSFVTPTTLTTGEMLWLQLGCQRSVNSLWLIDLLFRWSA